MQDPVTENIKIAEVAPNDIQTDEYYEDASFDMSNAGGRSNIVQKVLEPLKENPYPGLRPFKASESNVFFGRKDITFELITRLANHRFLAVLGASGSGKSSLVRAGLLPGLKTLPGKQGLWKIAICRPGKNPFGNLARAIGKASIAPSYTETEIRNLLSSSSYGFEELYSHIDTPELFNTLIVIDQFEELFRFRKDYGASGRNDAALFVKMLIDIGKIESLNTYVMITMRSEYLGDCVKFADLAEKINEGQFLVPRLKFKQLRDAIMEPASFTGASVDVAFADKLIGEIGDNMDQLPVLQHALRRSYEEAKLKVKERGSIQVKYEDYTVTGLMQNALNKHANEIYSSLDPNQQVYCEKLFKSLTDRASDGRGIRRPLSFYKILEICKESREDGDQDDQIYHSLKKVIDSFRQESVNFLMPPPHVAITDETEIDISHESLMRIWTGLQHWIDEEASDALLLYELLQRDKDEPIRGSKLIIFTEWTKRKKPGFNWASLYKPPDETSNSYCARFNEAIAILEWSKAYLEKYKKRQMFRRIAIIGIAASIFFSLALTLTATFKNFQLQTKNRNLQIAEKKIREKNEELSSANEEILDKKNTLELAYSKITDQKNRLEIQQAELKEQQRKLTIKQFELSAINKKLESKNDTITLQANNLKIENQAKEKTLTSLKLTRDSLKTVSDSATNLKNLALAIRHSEKSLSIPVNDLKREAIKARLALVAYQFYKNSGEEGDKKLQAQVYSSLYFALKNRIINDAFTKDVWPVTNYEMGSDRLAFAAKTNSRDNHPMIYMTAEDKKIYGFDLINEKGSVIDSSGTGNKIVGIEASEKGWIAVNTLSRKLLMINKQDRLKDTIFNLSGIVRSTKFSIDGSSLYVYTTDSMLNRINVEQKSTFKQKVAFKIEDIAVSSSFIYGLTANADVVKWNRNKSGFTDPVVIQSPIKQTIRGTAISSKPDDSIIIWGNENGQVFYLKNDNAGKAQYLTKFDGPITNIAFNNSFSRVAVASYDKTIQVFNLPDLQSDVPLVLNNNEGPVNTLFFQKDKEGKEELITVLSPGKVRVYPMDLQTLACRLYQSYIEKQPSADDLNTYIDKAAINNKVEIKCK